ncbi:MAG: GIY-YIG nuclease family protein [Pirellulaceae bacterium]|nr:GIY-YIG nuclease family protein [Pirellulaceae bacterium]
MLGLVPYLTASGVKFDPGNTKIHLACWNGIEHPLDVFYAGGWQAWQDGQTKRNFECSNVLSLIDLGRSHWLFVGVYEVLRCQPSPKGNGHFLYTTKLLANQSELIGRVIVHHQRTRQSYVWFKPAMELPIVEIRREKMTIADFPGYNAVVINHSSLQIITRQKIASWHAALANIKGVYLIVDTTTGKPYVGKASGSVGVWQRWCAYADNGHGGNVELKNVLKEKGSEHMRNFQYSILEIADTHASNEDILERESYWMNVLRSREFGLN